MSDYRHCFMCGLHSSFCRCFTSVPTYIPGHYSAPQLTEEDIRRIVREEIERALAGATRFSQGRKA